MQYYKRDDQALEAEWNKDRRAEASRSEGNGKNNVYTLKEGRTLVRILPSPTHVNNGMWFREMKEYYFKLDNEHLFLTSPRDFDLPDPLWEWGQSVYEEGNELAIEEAKRFRPTTRFIMNALVLSDPKEGKVEDGIKVLKVPQTVKEALVHFDYDREYGDITCPNQGFNINIDREGTGRNTKYRVMPQRNRSSIVELLKEKGMDATSLTLFDLDTEHKNGLRSHDELSAILEQVKVNVKPQAKPNHADFFGKPQEVQPQTLAPATEGESQTLAPQTVQPQALADVAAPQQAPTSGPVMQAPEGQPLPEVPKPPTGGEQ